MSSVSLPSPSPIIADPLTTSMLTALLPSAFLCCPVEVRDTILSQLSQPSLLHLSATCRYFRHLILSRRQYWKSITFDNTNERDVNANMIIQFISALPANSRAATTDINVGGVFINTLPEIVVALLQAFPNLISLDARSLNCLDLLEPLTSALAPLATTDMHQTRYRKFQRLLLVEKGESKVMPCEGPRTHDMASQLSSYLSALTSQGQHDIHLCEGCNRHLADIQYPPARCVACDEPVIWNTCYHCSYACERCGDLMCGECDGRLTYSCAICYEERRHFVLGFCTRCRCEVERECTSCHYKMCDKHTETCMCGALICSKEMGCCSECR
ncbi:hypothetical protein INT44_000919 [Umbelopsis vinacea]|uniref:F-box domain-containing protein n=1 Tax=Umbelopsis vinacea TaxID=44442 RepID=A0A8H7UQC2_9FUNG|nr:hypothetical protein INT44_000919 [Umbelopsis vinacea]